MKTGIVIVPFVDGKTGNAYQINNDFKANKKRFEELLKAGLISDGKEVEEVSEEESEEIETTEEVQNEESVEEESEGESVEPEKGEEESEEESDAE